MTRDVQFVYNMTVDGSCRDSRDSQSGLFRNSRPEYTIKISCEVHNTLYWLLTLRLCACPDVVLFPDPYLQQQSTYS
jgi:hypothetical protein